MLCKAAAVAPCCRCGRYLPASLVFPEHHQIFVCRCVVVPALRYRISFPTCFAIRASPPHRPFSILTFVASHLHRRSRVLANVGIRFRSFLALAQFLELFPDGEVTVFPPTASSLYPDGDFPPPEAQGAHARDTLSGSVRSLASSSGSPSAWNLKRKLAPVCYRQVRVLPEI